MRKRKRDSCEICKKAGRNPTGHVDVYCAFPGGPYAGRLDAARKARQEQVKREKDRLKDQQAFNAVVSSEQLLSETSTIDEINQRLDVQRFESNGDRKIVYEDSRRIDRLEARVKELETKLAKVEKFIAAKSAVAKGSKGKGNWTVSVVAKGSKGKGKGMYPSSYSHEYDGWDY